MININVPNFPESYQNISLEGVEYRLRLTYNTRDKHWRMSLLNLDNEEIISGIKIMPNQNLTWRYSYIDGMPPGNFYCLRLKNDYSDVGRDNLGYDKTYQLFYMTQQEDLLYGFAS